MRAGAQAVWVSGRVRASRIARRAPARASSCGRKRCGCQGESGRERRAAAAVAAATHKARETRSTRARKRVLVARESESAAASGKRGASPAWRLSVTPRLRRKKGFAGENEAPPHLRGASPSPPAAAAAAAAACPRRSRICSSMNFSLSGRRKWGKAGGGGGKAVKDCILSAAPPSISCIHSPLSPPPFAPQDLSHR